MELLIKTRNMYMELTFPLGSFHLEDGITFSEIPYIPEHFQGNEPNRRVPFTSQPEFLGVFGKWKKVKGTSQTPNSKGSSDRLRKVVAYKLQI